MTVQYARMFGNVARLRRRLSELELTEEFITSVFVSAPVPESTTVGQVASSLHMLKQAATAFDDEEFAAYLGQEPRPRRFASGTRPVTTLPSALTKNG